MTAEQYVDARDLSPRQRAIGFSRRLRALAWNGWPPESVALSYGFDGDLARIAVDEGAEGLRFGRVVDAETWHAAALAFDQLALRFGPDEALRARAVAGQWPPPLAWDDEDLDDGKRRAQGKPAGPYKGDPVVVFRRVHGDHSVPVDSAFQAVDRLPCVKILHARGWNDHQIANQIGASARQVQRDRTELNLPAILPDLLLDKPEGEGACCATRRVVVTRGKADFKRFARMAERHPDNLTYRHEAEYQRGKIREAERLLAEHLAEHDTEQSEVA